MSKAFWVRRVGLVSGLLGSVGYPGRLRAEVVEVLLFGFLFGFGVGSFGEKDSIQPSFVQQQRGCDLKISENCKASAV